MTVDRYGCYGSTRKKDVITAIAMGLFSASVIASEVLLFLLFIYPLITLWRKRKSLNQGDRTRQDKVYLLIQRASVCSSVVAIVLIAAAILGSVTSSLGFPASMPDFIFSIFVSINAVCTISTFRKNKKILRVAFNISVPEARVHPSMAMHRTGESSSRGVSNVTPRQK